MSTPPAPPENCPRCGWQWQPDYRENTAFCHRCYGSWSQMREYYPSSRSPIPYHWEDKGMRVMIRVEYEGYKFVVLARDYRYPENSFHQPFDVAKDESRHEKLNEMGESAMKILRLLRQTPAHPDEQNEAAPA